MTGEGKHSEHYHTKSPKADSLHIVSDGKLDCAMRSDTLQNMIIKSGQSPTKVIQGLGQDG